MNRGLLDLSERARPYLVAPLLVLLASLPPLRALGALGVRPLASWRGAARHALALMFAVTARAHFGKQREDLIRMVPPGIPRPRGLVTATGALEFLGALGLAVPQTARLAGGGLTLLLVALFPANIHAARRRIGIGGKPTTPLWFRALVQVVFIALILWATRQPGAARDGSNTR